MFWPFTFAGNAVGAILGVLAAANADLTPVYVGLVGGAGAIIGALITEVPRRKSLLSEAHRVAVETVIEANEELEKRLKATENQLIDYEQKLGIADRRIADLEEQLGLARQENAIQKERYELQLEDARQKREVLHLTVEELRAEVGELRAQLPD